MKSMTGFGKAAGTLADGTEASVVVRGVNHRFLDVAVKLRDEYASAEPAIRRAVAVVAARGHIDVLIRTTRPAGRTPDQPYPPGTAGHRAGTSRFRTRVLMWSPPGRAGNRMPGPSAAGRGHS